MNRPLLSPGWALVIVFLLWGLAGALEEPFAVGRVSGAEAPWIPSARLVRLACEPDFSEGPEVYRPGNPGNRDTLRPSLVTFRTAGAGCPASEQPVGTFRCHFID